MITDRDLDLLKEAVAELARLRNVAGDETRLLPQLYASALEEWAIRLGMDPSQLNKLVVMKDAVQSRPYQVRKDDAGAI